MTAKRLILGSGFTKKEANDTTLDINAECEPDVVWDLNKHPLPFADESFDTIIASDVLEHLGDQGDYKFFFREFGEYWRILKDGGIMFCAVPKWDSTWAFADPGHRRVLTPNTFGFLCQKYYERVGTTAVTDYRRLWDRNFNIVKLDEDEHRNFIWLQKTSPFASASPTITRTSIGDSSSVY